MSAPQRSNSRSYSKNKGFERIWAYVYGDKEPPQQPTLLHQTRLLLSVGLIHLISLFFSVIKSKTKVYLLCGCIQHGYGRTQDNTNLLPEVLPPGGNYALAWKGMVLFLFLHVSKQFQSRYTSKAMVDAVHGPYIAADIGVVAWQTMAKWMSTLTILSPTPEYAVHTTSSLS